MEENGLISSLPLWSPQILPDASQHLTPVFSVDDNPSEWSIPADDPTGGAASSSKSHSQAEKRRRDRINAQLARLRKLVPRSDKMDKAALLGSSVDHFKELRKKANEISKGITVPSEIDEVVVEECLGSQQDQLIKATLCCEERPELFKDLLRTLKSLKLIVVGADIACLGGRAKTILILSAMEGEVGALKQPLKAALGRIASFCNTSLSGYRLTSRRQRLLFPSLN